MDKALIVAGVGKKYLVRDPNRFWTFQESVTSGFRRKREYFWSLRDVSFTLSAGRVLGVIGRNGAGKSTLLRLIAGIGRPDEGSINAKGRVGGLLELGAGLHSDLSGRENIFIGGVIRGFTRSEVRRRFASIVEFSELQSSIDKPLRTYSSGMYMRLAFSIAIHTQPDILLIDEVLAVGDIAFQQKCFDAISSFKQTGGTIVLVSHQLNIVEEMCDDAIWLNTGRTAAAGPGKTVCRQYADFIKEATRPRDRTTGTLLEESSITASPSEVGRNRHGSLEVSIDAVRILSASGIETCEFASGDSLSVELTYSVQKPIESPIFGVTLRQPDGTVCYNANSDGGSLKLPALNRPGRVTLHIARLGLDPGEYHMDVGIYERQWAYAYDYQSRVRSLRLREAHGPVARLGLPTDEVRWSWLQS